MIESKLLRTTLPVWLSVEMLKQLLMLRQQQQPGNGIACDRMAKLAPFTYYLGGLATIQSLGTTATARLMGLALDTTFVLIDLFG